LKNFFEKLRNAYVTPNVVPITACTTMLPVPASKYAKMCEDISYFPLYLLLSTTIIAKILRMQHFRENLVGP
jgi:hypothetical protein